MQSLSLLQAYRNKIAYKLGLPVVLKAQGVSKGTILLSYLASPFTLARGERKTDPHTSYAECAKIAELFLNRGYDVDVIDWNNDSFVPKKKYRVCIDIQKNLERLNSFLPTECAKVMHVVSAYSKFQNDAEASRLRRIKSHRGAVVAPRRTDTVSLNPKYAQFLEGFGNTTTHSTYSQFGKSIFPINPSVAHTFPFPENKDFEKAKRNFLWFGGGGAVHKGLDLVLEAFSQIPDIKLHIVGPIAGESDFVNAYKVEFSSPHIVVHNRPRTDEYGNMTVDGKPFTDITNDCVALIYPSCSEGTSGAVIQAMHAGMIPIVTRETGIREDAPIRVLDEASVENIQREMLAIINTPEKALRDTAHKVWLYAQNNYSMEKFEKSYNEFIDTYLKL